MNTTARTNIFLTVLSLLALTFALSACGGDVSTSADGITISFWHFWSEPGQKNALLEQIAAFEQANPGIKVELGELSWDQGKTKLFAAFSSNTAPDVLELGSDWIAQFSSEGVLADQGAMAGDSTSRYQAQILAPGVWEGKSYAWPWIIATRGLFYNKGLINATEGATFATWQDVLAQAEQVRTKNPEAYGFGANGPDGHRLYKKILPFFWSNGGEVLNEKGVPVIYSPENLEALEMYLTLARNGLFETQKQLDQLFLQGKVAFWISGPWLTERIMKDNPELQYGIAPLPGFPGKQAISFIGGEYLAINAASEHKEAAKKLITFLTSPAQALAFGKTLPGGYAPADLTDAANNAFLQSPEQKVFTAQFSSARLTPVHPKWLDIEEILEDEVSAAILGKKEAGVALEDAQYRVTRLLQGESVEHTEGEATGS